MQVEKEVVKAIRQMEEVEVEVKRKKEVSSRVKQLRRQVSVTPPVDSHDPACLTKKTYTDCVVQLSNSHQANTDQSLWHHKRHFSAF